MKTAILILLTAALLAQTTDADRLKIRDAQRMAAEAVAAKNALEAQYWQAQRAVDQAQMNVSAVLQEIGKARGCTVDPKTADCRPEPSAPPTEKK